MRRTFRNRLRRGSFLFLLLVLPLSGVAGAQDLQDLAEQLVQDMREFRKANGCDRLVMIWCGSTEVYLQESPVHATVASLEQGLEASDDSIPSSMIYAYAAIREGIPYANAAPLNAMGATNIFFCRRA